MYKLRHFEQKRVTGGFSWPVLSAGVVLSPWISYGIGKIYMEHSAEICLENIQAVIASNHTSVGALDKIAGISSMGPVCGAQAVFHGFFAGISAIMLSLGVTAGAAGML